jgi:predicted CXXCH cytochrome family protein
MIRTLRGLATLAGAVLLALSFLAGAQSAPRPPATYVGTSACAGCHAKQHESWRGSQHDRAMQAPDETTVLGDFGGVRFSHAGVTSRFFRRDGRFLVTTDGPDGKLADFEVRYTFGVHPLQQYLIELPGGRLQALGVAWDARTKAQGGQRWFHLYPDRKLKAGDPLHWTGIDQNWNYQCADCHSTNVRKNYDASTRTYRTTWSDLDVGCEACHGPGSGHVAWAKQDADARRALPGKGLTVVFDERAGVRWPIDAASGSARRSTPRLSDREGEVCARCHARRGQFDDAWHAGQPPGDAFRLALLESGLYHPDGQMRDEVYNTGSFLQSRMHAMGVGCSDCHDPHTQKLRASGDAVCAQCHLPARFEAASHHRHKPGTAGAACVSCHMPTVTYMRIDARHDHSMRIPRPDRTLSLGVPNACNACHANRSPAWAADAVARWYPDRKPGQQRFAEALAAGDRGASGANAQLAALLADTSQPGIARASAIPRLMAHPGRGTMGTLAKALDDLDALVRASAARALGAADPAARARLLPRLLGDPAREVRMEAARGLAGVPDARLPPDERARLSKATDEYLAALRFNADRPEAHAELGTFHLARGQRDAAIAAYRTALDLDPSFAPAIVNLADAYRQGGQESEAERVLVASAKAYPKAAEIRHALGLSLVRQKRPAEALKALGEAAALAPDNARFAYVYGVALHDAGRRADAMRTLDAALARHPYDREILYALASYERAAGNAAKAARRANLLAGLEPDDANVAQFARELEAAAARPAATR